MATIHNIPSPDRSQPWQAASIAVLGLNNRDGDRSAFRDVRQAIGEKRYVVGG
mgnify:CR=1 FL=1